MEEFGCETSVARCCGPGRVDPEWSLSVSVWIQQMIQHFWKAAQDTHNTHMNGLSIGHTTPPLNPGNGYWGTPHWQCIRVFLNMWTDFTGILRNKGKTNTYTHSCTAGKYEFNPAKWRKCQILSVTSYSLWSTEYLISTSYSNKVALIFREFGFYNWMDVIMNDLHEGLSQACFISSLRLLKLCQSFLSHSKTLRFFSQGLGTVCTVFCY